MKFDPRIINDLYVKSAIVRSVIEEYGGVISSCVLDHLESDLLLQGEYESSRMLGNSLLEYSKTLKTSRAKNMFLGVMEMLATPSKVPVVDKSDI